MMSWSCVTELGISAEEWGRQVDDILSKPLEPNEVKVCPLSVWLCKICNCIFFTFKKDHCQNCGATGDWFEKDFEVVKDKLRENGHIPIERPEYTAFFESFEKG